MTSILRKCQVLISFSKQRGVLDHIKKDNTLFLGNIKGKDIFDLFESKSKNLYTLILNTL